MGKVWVVIISIIVGLGISECIVRSLGIVPAVALNLGSIRFVDNPKMVYEFVPGEEMDAFAYANKQGFNGKDFILDKPAGQVRIAMLGDSITQGVGVSQRDNFSAQLQGILNQASQEAQSPVRYEVMNFGIGGYNLEAEIEVLKNKVLQFKPDIVVLNLFFNDNEPIPGIHQFFVVNNGNFSEAQQMELVKRYVYNHNSLARVIERNFLYRSKLYVLLISQAANIQRALLGKPRIALDGDQNMRPVYYGFQEIGELKKKAGFKFLICLHPFLLFDEHPNDALFASIAEKFNFEYFYMMPYYRRSGVVPEALQLEDRPDDRCHPNKFGHSLVAQALFQEMQKRGLIDIK